MRPIDDIKRELREWVAEGIPETIKALKAVLASHSTWMQELTLIEGRLKDANLSALRGVISNEDLQLLYNQLRAALLDIINAINNDDVQPANPVVSSAPKTRTGNILYRIPAAMQLHKEHKCVVRIAFSEEQLLDNIEIDANVRLQGIRVADVMLVQMLDPSEPATFHIRSVNSAEQFLEEEAYAEWLFYVKPLMEGTFPLLLKVAVLEVVNGKERQREIVLEERVQITTQDVEGPKEAPLQKADYALRFSGPAEDTAIYAPPQPRIAESKSRRAAATGVIRALAMIGVFSVLGLVAVQYTRNAAPDPDTLWPVIQPDKLDTTAIPPLIDDIIVPDTLPPGPTDTLPQQEPALPEPITVPNVEFVKVRGGTFAMGCAGPDTLDCAENEYPVRQVRVKDFAMSTTEVTRSQFVDFLNACGCDRTPDGPYKGKRMFGQNDWLQRDASGKWSVGNNSGQLPATHITWYGADAFARFFQWRLPSEAEWEYAAKGGRTNSSFSYAGADALGEVGWYRANAKGKLQPVQLKMPNGIGLYDMSGNVWEWTADCYHPTYENAPPDGRAWNYGGDCNRRTLRGGSFIFPAESARVQARMEGRLDDASEHIGFRVVRAHSPTR